MAGRHYCQSFIPQEKGGRVWKETDAKHLLTLERLWAKILWTHTPQNGDEVLKYI